MKEYATLAEVCSFLHGMEIDTKAPCKPIGKAAVKGLGAVTALSLETTGVIRYAVVIENGGKFVVSEPTTLITANCGMQKCDLTDVKTPRLRVLKTAKPQVALEVAVRLHHESYNDGSGRTVTRITDRWSEYHLGVCAMHDGAFVCTAQSWGSRQNSCTNKLADTGALTSTCTNTINVGVDR